MHIIIMRHGEAEALYSADPLRNLTSVGHRQALVAGQWLKQQGYGDKQIDLALVSPYNRAQQTYEGLLASVSVKSKRTWDDIVPMSDPMSTHILLDELLADYTDDAVIILVSHMPFVSYFLEELAPGSGLAIFATASMKVIDYSSSAQKGRLHSTYYPKIQ